MSELRQRKYWAQYGRAISTPALPIHACHATGSKFETRSYRLTSLLSSLTVSKKQNIPRLALKQSYCWPKACNGLVARCPNIKYQQKTASLSHCSAQSAAMSLLNRFVCPKHFKTIICVSLRLTASFIWDDATLASKHWVVTCCQ